MVLKNEPGDVCMLGKFCAMIEAGSQCSPMWPFASYPHVLASKVARVIDLHHQGSVFVERNPGQRQIVADTQTLLDLLSSLLLLVTNLVASVCAQRL